MASGGRRGPADSSRSASRDQRPLRPNPDWSSPVELLQSYTKPEASIWASDVNMLLLLLGLLCLLLPLLFRCAVQTDILEAASSILLLSRASSIMMLVAYVAYLFFQLKTHRQLFEAQEEVDESDDVLSEEKPVIGFWSAFIWLVGMTIIIALLSEYVVGTIEAASDSWGISVSFISVILLPIVGNAAEHAGSVIFAFKNKLDISLGVALGSAAQISMFVVPLCVVVAWIMGVNMDLDFNLLETGSLAFSIIVTAFTLQTDTVVLYVVAGCNGKYYLPQHCGSSSSHRIRRKIVEFRPNYKGKKKKKKKPWLPLNVCSVTIVYVRADKCHPTCLCAICACRLVANPVDVCIEDRDRSVPPLPFRFELFRFELPVIILRAPN
ncbi:hypothetical protein HYC85_017423 [Camellia sinensis]|uniref:Sodium/calcium exchanger membrane region domain-containing protein n=1 Tax=Camellia sinensis TaxID=4442 RepID=A0A7J7GV16_CAMSI|nr:hypothetical protein HYC85_017423 [Camellia sinensis]